MDCAASSGGPSAPLPSLYDLLLSCDLCEYYAELRGQLKVHTVDHLRHVHESDLLRLGMSKPEVRRLLCQVDKHCPPGILHRIKRALHQAKPAASGNGTAPSDGQHIIPSEAITLCKQLGAGEFGSVWQAAWNTASGTHLQVAVKCLTPAKMQSNLLDFLQEAAIMHKISHAHICAMYGVVLETKKIMLVSELAPLRSLLECLRDETLRASFPLARLCFYAEQICSGMAYLESQRMIHRDLAARNILVFAAETVKVTDFGLSRALGSTEDYYKGNFSLSLKLPIAWCAPECIKYLRFTSASDVWSFGVTMWEMFTYGFQPWAGHTGAEILAAVDAPNCRRMCRPDACPSEHHALMALCWSHEAHERPTFDQLARMLRDIRPDKVKTVAHWRDGQPDHLQYDKSTIITVIDKTPAEYPDGYYWKGSLPSGRTGLFLPSNTIAHMELDRPLHCHDVSADAALRSHADNNAHDSAWKSPLKLFAGGGRKQSPGGANATSVRPEISTPVGPVQHRVHVGLDGVVSDESADTLVVKESYTKVNDDVNAAVRRRRGAAVPIRTAACDLPPPPRPDKPRTQHLDDCQPEQTVGDSAVPSSDNAACSPTDNAISNRASSLQHHAHRQYPTSDDNSEPIAESTSRQYFEDALAALEAGMRFEPETDRLIDERADNNNAPPAPAQLRPLSNADARLLCDLRFEAERLSEKAFRYGENQRRHVTDNEEQEHRRRMDELKQRISQLMSRSCALSNGNNNNMVGDTAVGAERPVAFSDALPPADCVDNRRQQWTPEAQSAYQQLVECGRQLRDSLCADGHVPPPSTSPHSAHGGAAAECGDRGQRSATATAAGARRKPPTVPPKPKVAPHWLSERREATSRSQLRPLPPMSFEACDKYELLDFVVEAIDRGAVEDRRAAEQSNEDADSDDIDMPIRL